MLELARRRLAFAERGIEDSELVAGVVVDSASLVSAMYTLLSGDERRRGRAGRAETVHQS